MTLTSTTSQNIVVPVPKIRHPGHNFQSEKSLDVAVWREHAASVDGSAIVPPRPHALLRGSTHNPAPSAPPGDWGSGAYWNHHGLTGNIPPNNHCRHWQWQIHYWVLVNFCVFLSILHNPKDMCRNSGPHDQISEPIRCQSSVWAESEDNEGGGILLWLRFF